MTNRWENNGNSDRLYLFIYLFIYLFGGVGSPKSLQMVTVAMKVKDEVGRLKKKIGRSRSMIYHRSIKTYDKHKQYIKKQRHYFVDKGLSSQSYDFFPVVMYGCESWTKKRVEC